MLAWVHQALAGEREFVVALFGDDKAATSEGSGHSPSSERGLAGTHHLSVRHLML